MGTVIRMADPIMEMATKITVVDKTLEMPMPMPLLPRMDPTVADAIITVTPARSVVVNMAIYDVLLTSRRHVSSKDVMNTPTSLSMRRMNDSCYP